MIFKKKYLITILIITLSFSQSLNLYNIDYNKDTKIKISNNYYHHSGANSQSIKDSTIIDIFEYKFICSNKKLIEVTLKNEHWNNFNDNINFKKYEKNIIISDPIIIRGTPIISVKVIPWKIGLDGSFNYLTNFKLDIKIKPDLDITNLNFIPHNVLNNNFKKNNIDLEPSSTEYLIISSPELINASNELGNIHSIEIDENDRLLVEVISTNQIIDEFGELNSQSIRDYLLNFINNDIYFNLKYILLMGDESQIPPFYYNNSPTDDYYTSTSTIFLMPQIPTGRIPVSNINDANNIVQQIRKYLITPNSGYWKSKTLLISDDQNHPDQEEFSHVINSNILYQIIKDDLNLINLYGTDYIPIPSDGWYNHPLLTQDLITTINSGVSLINYIGHGNSTSLAHENILNLDRDLSLIEAEQQAIWIVGTCSFGYYDNNTCMAEELLIKENGSIAIITSTRSVYATVNIQYLTRVFNIMNNYINNDIDISNIRLGDLFFLSKESNNDYLFQLFGDPALKLIFPKKSAIIDLEQSDVSFQIGQPNDLYFHQNDLFDYSMIINGPEKYNEIGYYNPGDIIFQGIVSNNPTTFYIPLDIIQCDTCKAKVTFFSESTITNTNKIDSYNNFPISNTDLSNLNDNNGPEISLWNHYNQINEIGLILDPLLISVAISDQSGINLTGSLGHNLKYYINDEEFIMNQTFNYIQEDSGYALINLNGEYSWPINLEIEAWDNINNSSNKKYLLYKGNNPNFHIDKIYNFPNPFKTDTYFTFLASENSKIKISIYSINGNLIATKESSVNASEFSQIYWDGKDKGLNEISNGTYFYHLLATNNNGEKFEHISKLTKIE